MFFAYTITDPGCSDYGTALLCWELDKHRIQRRARLREFAI